jgi:hypothetical protein
MEKLKNQKVLVGRPQWETISLLPWGDSEQAWKDQMDGGRSMRAVETIPAASPCKRKLSNASTFFFD